MHGLGHIFNFLPTSILSVNDHDDDDDYDDDDDDDHYDDDDDDDGDENSEPGKDPVPVDVVEPEDPHQLLLLGALQQQREVHHKVLMRKRMVTMTMKMMIAMSMVTMMMTMKMMIAMTMTMIKTIMMVMITTTMMMMTERPTPKVRPPEPDSSRREKM